MEWNLLNEDQGEDLSEVEIRDFSDDEDSRMENKLPITKLVNARRAIEILKEQKQLKADTWDCFE